MKVSPKENKKKTRVIAVLIKAYTMENSSPLPWPRNVS
jgi:hypothetical protein